MTASNLKITNVWGVLQKVSLLTQGDLAVTTFLLASAGAAKRGKLELRVAGKEGIFLRVKSCRFYGFALDFLSGGPHHEVFTFLQFLNLHTWEKAMGVSTTFINLTGDVSGQHSDAAFSTFEQLGDATRKLLFGDNPDQSLIEGVYAKQQYAVQISGKNIWISVAATSPESQSPRAIAWLPPGFIATGGGGRANWLTSASHLTTSIPVNMSGVWGWEVRSSGQTDDAVTLDAVAMGIRL